MARHPDDGRSHRRADGSFSATWSGIRLRGIKLDFLDLNGAKVSNTVIEDCVIGELELAEADLRRVRFPGSSIGILGSSGARLTDVDLSGARLRTIGSIAGLRGATLSADQLIDLAPLLAAHVGIRLDPERLTDLVDDRALIDASSRTSSRPTRPVARHARGP